MTRFDVYLIKPTRYDDAGYPLQWRRSVVPSNSLACVAALVADAAQRRVLGEAAEIAAHPIDEVNHRVDTEAIIARARGGGRVMVMLVGVQTNMYPRAMDIARPLRAAGVPVCIGGFHVSGCVAMLGADTPELALARELSVSMFAGEAEDGRIDEVLRDGFDDRLKPLYDHLADMPALGGAPPPILPPEIVARGAKAWSSFDLGRGCPFECSFCTIINVQGRKSRFRTADDLEKVVRENWAVGIYRFFITDDNLARNRNWEAYADRLIELREREGIKLRFIIQVDTLAHLIPRFVDKMYRAGAHIIFIGLENINSDSLEAVKKRQNRIEDYRRMLMAWKRHGALTVCGYIVGFPNDTRVSILHDIEVLKRELPIDVLYLNYLTPLPGCEDHRRLQAAGGWMDPDFSRYNLSRRVTHHPRMSDAEWDAAYAEAHRRFYDRAHVRRIFDRMLRMDTWQPFTLLTHLLIYREGPRLEGVGPSELGLWRIVRRRQRRHGLPLEHPLVFYPRETLRAFHKLGAYVLSWLDLRLSLAAARWDLTHARGRAWGDPAIEVEGGEAALIAETAERSTERARKRQAAHHIELADAA